MKIAQVMTASTGGIGRHVASVAVRMVERGHEVRIFCPKLTARAQGLRELGLDVRPLSALAGARQSDVVHAHGYKAGGLALGVRHPLGPPLVVTWHNALLGGSRRRGVAALVLRQAVARGADVTLGASSDLVDQARRLGARNTRVAPVAAPELDLSGVDRAAVRRELGLGLGDIAVLTVSRLAPQKNLGLLADVAAQLINEPWISFFVVGEGPQRSFLERRIAAEGLRIRLLGRRDDLAGLLAAADLSLLTSTWEARALVAQEALIAGLPLVSTRVGGIPELVGDAAVLVASGDPEAMTTAVRRLAADAAERAALTDAGRIRAAGWPDEDAVTEDLLTAYRSVI